MTPARDGSQVAPARWRWPGHPIWRSTALNGGGNAQTPKNSLTQRQEKDPYRQEYRAVNESTNKVIYLSTESSNTTRKRRQAAITYPRRHPRQRYVFKATAAACSPHPNPAKNSAWPQIPQSYRLSIYTAPSNCHSDSLYQTLHLASLLTPPYVPSLPTSPLPTSIVPHFLDQGDDSSTGVIP